MVGDAPLHWWDSRLLEEIALQGPQAHLWWYCPRIEHPLTRQACFDSFHKTNPSYTKKRGPLAPDHWLWTHGLTFTNAKCISLRSCKVNSKSLPSRTHVWLAGKRVCSQECSFSLGCARGWDLSQTHHCGQLSTYLTIEESRLGDLKWIFNYT